MTHGQASTDPLEAAVVGSWALKRRVLFMYNMLYNSIYFPKGIQWASGLENY